MIPAYYKYAGHWPQGQLIPTHHECSWGTSPRETSIDQSDWGTTAEWDKVVSKIHSPIALQDLEFLKMNVQRLRANLPLILTKEGEDE